MTLSILDQFISIYQFPTGRRVYAIGQIREALAELGIADLEAEAAKALEADERLNVLETQQRAESQTGGLHSPRARELDVQMDRLLVGFESMLAGQARTGEGTPEGEAAAWILRQAFPEGVGAVTHLSFIEQHVAVDTMVKRLQSGDLVEAGQKLPWLAATVERIAGLNRDYDEALEVPGSARLRQVISEAREEGQANLVRLIVQVMGRFPERTQEEKAKLASILKDFVRQDGAIRSARKRRRKVRDIDPQTGEELEFAADEDSGEADEAASPAPAANPIAFSAEDATGSNEAAA